jgi:hypothetical protein
MPSPTTNRLRSAGITAAAAGIVLVLSACTAPSAPVEPTPIPSARSGLPGGHVHGLTVNGQTGQAFLATHEGLFDLSKEPAVKIGSTIDLMGFTAAVDGGVFYASGHPGPGSSLPNPLGLIRSSDGGKTWEQLSRQRESDFHTLATTKSGIVAFDGTLRTSTDGKVWRTIAAGFVPAVLAANPYSDTVLATTRDGVQRSTDGGVTWALDKSSPIIQFAAFASAKEAVGVAPDGTVHYSPDAGATWSRTGRIAGQVQAVAATDGPDGRPWIWTATSAGLVVSTDGGATFRAADAS